VHAGGHGHASAQQKAANRSRQSREQDPRFIHPDGPVDYSPGEAATMTFEDSIVIDASPALLFELSQDYKRRLGWDPFLRSAELLNGAVEPAVGVRALCVDQKGTAMETEYVSFNPPRAAAVKMTRGPWFLASFAGSWRFEEVNPGQTRVGFCYSLSARPRWLSWLMNPVLERVFASDTRRRLTAFKEAAEQRGVLNEYPASERGSFRC
jgi:ribosome-associated toxin RatA of RatAB toxin-antitoxin module